MTLQLVQGHWRSCYVVLYFISTSLSINIASISASCVDLSPITSVGLCVGRSVCLSLSVGKVYCGKMVDWIRMAFGMVSGVGRTMGVLDGGGNRPRERGSLGVNFGRPSVTNGDLIA